VAEVWSNQQEAIAGVWGRIFSFLWCIAVPACPEQLDEKFYNRKNRTKVISCFIQHIGI
jgi:hypothetical protein